VFLCSNQKSTDKQSIKERSMSSTAHDTAEIRKVHMAWLESE
jgi:hypothetical protein